MRFVGVFWNDYVCLMFNAFVCCVCDVLCDVVCFVGVLMCLRVAV